MSILVVEDDAGIRSAISEALREEGYPVYSFADGTEALQYLRSNPLPTLILLDLRLRGIDGREFRRLQLADPQLAKIPVVVVSGSSEARECAQQMVVDDFVSKPLSLDELLHVVQNRSATVPRAEHFLRGAYRPTR